MHFRSQPGYSFDDVLLVPKHSEVASRKDVDLSTRLGTTELQLPILSANMDTVTGPAMAIAMHQCGGAGVLHRFATDGDIERWVSNIRQRGAPAIMSVGVNRNGQTVELVRRVLELSGLDAVCVDVAHGHHVKTMNTVEDLRDEFADLDIIAGNVATGPAAVSLVEKGANIIKVGIGPGAVCSTRVVTGHGVPQLTAIVDVCSALSLEGMIDSVQVIADGGIRYPGDIVKALAAGADAVMLGSVLAGTTESPGQVFIEHKNTFKTFRGSASSDAQRNQGADAQVEGVAAQVAFRGPVELTLTNFAKGIRSGLSYSGARDLLSLRNRAEFIVVTANSVKEGHPHQPYLL